MVKMFHNSSRTKRRFDLLNRKTVAIILILGLILPVCSPKKKIDSEEVKNEIEARSPKKVSESDIIEKALVLGSEIASKSQAKLASSLKSALQSGGIEHAIKFCNLNAFTLIDSLQYVHGAEIRRVTFKTRNEKDTPDELESKILEAYENAQTNSLELKDHAQILEGDEYVLFTRPITINNALCLSCHGQLGEGLTEEALNTIKKHYPDDQATGYAMNDLRGMWSIKILKSGIVKTL
jgi:hypothetical protein